MAPGARRRGVEALDSFFIFGERLDVVTGLKSFIPVSVLFGAAIAGVPVECMSE